MIVPSRFHIGPRRAIAQAVAGDLSATAERALRTHLTNCAGCRDTYDELARLTTAIRAPGENSVADNRARERLLLALDGHSESAPKTTTTATRHPWRRWSWLLVPVAAAVLLARGATQSESEKAPARGETWRGGTETSTDKSNDAVGALVIYARARNANGAIHLRLVADFPKSGEGQVSLSDYVQFGIRGLPSPSYICVVGIDERGEFHQYVPSPGTTTERTDVSVNARPLGVSVDFGVNHVPGRLFVHALISSRPLDLEQVRKATKTVATPAARLDLPVAQISGTLTLTAAP